MKQLKVGDLKFSVCEHKGDINYLRFVQFKKYAPQFWEKMDCPLFKMYLEKFMDFYNQGKYANGLAVLKDYQFAIDNSKHNYDAWIICFAYITLFEDEDPIKELNEVELQEKIKKFTDAGITAKTVHEEVINFMTASPETFSEHLIYLMGSLASEVKN